MNNHPRHDSIWFIQALEEAIISPPPMKTWRKDHKGGKECKEWDIMYYKALNEQLALYLKGEGRLQTNN